MVIRTRTVEPQRKQTAFEQIKEGLEETVAVAKGETEPYKLHTPKRRPNGDAKKLITLRLDPEVIEAFKKGGEGWQSRINEVLRKAAGL